VCEVYFIDGIDVRRGACVQHYVLGDLFAHHAHRHDVHALVCLVDGIGGCGRFGVFWDSLALLWIRCNRECFGDSALMSCVFGNVLKVFAHEVVVLY